MGVCVMLLGLLVVLPFPALLFYIVAVVLVLVVVVILFMLLTYYINFCLRLYCYLFDGLLGCSAAAPPFSVFSVYVTRPSHCCCCCCCIVIVMLDAGA